MKVLMISEYFPPDSQGGGEISAYLLAKNLVKKGIDMHVLTSTKKSPYFELMDGIKVHRLIKNSRPNTMYGNLKRLGFSKNLRKKVIGLQKKESFDLVHCMNTSSIVAVKCIDKPFIMHVNGPTPFCPKATLLFKDKEACEKKCHIDEYTDCVLNSNIIGKTRQNKLAMPLFLIPLRLRYNMIKECMMKFDYYMPISTYMERKLIERGVKKDRIKIIYNLEEESKVSLKKIKPKKNKVLYLGDYTRLKGADIALYAVNSLNLEASFYGEGNLESYLKENANQNVKINRKIAHSEVKKVIMEHDIVLFPSFVGEAFGRVAMEACMLKKTVIASRIGGVPDIIEDGITGFLFEPKNKDELTEILEKVVKGELSIDKEKMLKKIKFKFSSEKTLNDVVKVYKKLNR